MESYIRYVPIEVYYNIKKLMEYRNIISNYNFVSRDDFSKVKASEYIKIDGTRSFSGTTRDVFIFMIMPDSKYSSTSPVFRKLLTLIPTDKKETADILFISSDPFSNHLIKVIDDERHNYPKIYIEHYTYEKFSIEIPKCDSVPHHEIVPDADAKEILKWCYKKKYDMPKILVSDTPVVWIGGKPGDLIKIDRISETTGKYIVYRYCIKR
jgi:DNA-directed RNA polymerase subunit H (RpoH/RPB5)